MSASAKAQEPRIKALRRFGVSITLFNVVGHTYLGFEMSYAHPLVGMVVAYGLELAHGWLYGKSTGRPAPFRGGGPVGLIDYLLPAHITAMACAMLLYTNGTYMPLVFAVTVGVTFKYLFRAPVGNGRTIHFFNPSNTGIALTLAIFPWISIAPPYQFTANLTGVGDWLLPALVLVTGTLLNYNLTKKMPLIYAWVGTFLLQALFRSAFHGVSLLHALSPMTGVAFVLFTFYMITDPGTTPFKPRNQAVFGASVAVVYGFLMSIHLVYAIFFALLIVCAARGLLLHALAWRHAIQQRRVEAAEPARVDLPEPRAGLPRSAGVR